MQRRQERHAAGEIVRAIALARLDRHASDVEVAGDAAPFRHVGLQYLQHIIRDRSVEFRTLEVLSAR